MKCGTQCDLNTTLDATEHVRVLTVKSSTCVYIAFRAAFSLVSLTGFFQILFVNALISGEGEFFICLDKHVSCPCLHDSNVSRCVAFCVVHILLALIRWATNPSPSLALFERGIRYGRRGTSSDPEPTQAISGLSALLPLCLVLHTVCSSLCGHVGSFLKSC